MEEGLYFRTGPRRSWASFKSNSGPRRTSRAVAVAVVAVFAQKLSNVQSSKVDRVKLK